MRSSISYTLAAALAVQAAPALQNTDGIKVSLANRHVPAIRHAHGTSNMAAYLAELNHLLVKYNADPLPEHLRAMMSSRRPTRRGNNEALIDQVDQGEDVLYYGSGTVGAKQPQTFTFNFDTGSSDLFVPGPRCGSAQGCPGTTKYSQTGQDRGNTTTVVYGSGEVMGENYLDSVTIAGLTAERQNIVSLSQAQGFSTSSSDSLLGMAFQSIANSNASPYFQTLIAQRKVTTQEFAFYLGRAESGTQGQSELTLGGRDSSRYTGAVTQVPVTSQTYWQIALDALTVNGRSVGSYSRGQAAIDTGTTVILAPTAATAALFARIPGSFPVPLASGSPLITLYAYPCSYTGTVALQFAGRQFKINPLDFNFGQLTPSILSSLGITSPRLLASTAAGGTCVAGIAGADLSPMQNLYVVGDTFLKNWYSIYSFNNYLGRPSVSFAAAVGNQ